MDGDRDALRVVGREGARGPRRQRCSKAIAMSPCHTAEKSHCTWGPAAEDLEDDGDDLVPACECAPVICRYSYTPTSI